MGKSRTGSHKISPKKAWLICFAIAIVLLALAAAWMIMRETGNIRLHSSTVNAGNMQYRTVTHNGKEYRYNDDILHILCLGIDKEEVMWERDDDGNSIGQADALFVASLNPKTDEVTVLSIPRDTMVILDMYDSAGGYRGQRAGQITLQYAYADGMEKSATLTAQRVSELLNGIPIHGYAAINLSCISVLNDAVGGVDVTLEEDYTDINPLFVKGETVHLEGVLAEEFVARRNFHQPQTAYKRLFRQKQYLTAFFEKAKAALKQNPALFVDLLRAQKDNTEISLTADEILYLTTELMDCRFDAADMQILPGRIVKGEIYEEYYLDENAVLDMLVEIYYE